MLMTLLIFRIDCSSGVIILVILRVSAHRHLSHRPLDIVNDENVRDGDDGEWNDPVGDKDDQDE